MATEAFHNALRQVVLPAHDPRDLLAFWPRQFITVSLIVALTIVNGRGTRLGGKFQILLTIIKVVSLSSLVVLPVVIYCLEPTAAAAPSVKRFAPVWPTTWSFEDLSRIGTAFVGVCWAYQGWMNIGPIAAEVRDPQRNVPRAVLGGIATVALIYITVNVSYYTVLTSAEMAALTGTPVATEFCLRLLGPVGAVIASLALMISVTGSLNGNILVAPRLLYAMAEDGLAPRRLHELHPRFQTPLRAMIVYSGWSILLVLGLGALTVYRLPNVTIAGLRVDPNLTAGKDPFDVLTEFAIFGALVFETLAVLSLFWLRRRPVSAETSYRCPWYPVVPAIYVLVMAAIAINMLIVPKTRGEAVIGLAFMALGGLVYAVIRPRRRG
jgi:amino acid transporter